MPFIHFYIPNIPALLLYYHNSLHLFLVHESSGPQISLDFVPNLNTYLTNVYNICMLISNELHTCTTVYVITQTKTEYINTNMKNSSQICDNSLLWRPVYSITNSLKARNYVLFTYAYPIPRTIHIKDD